MGRSQETFGKKARESKKQQKKKDKLQKKEERQLDSKKGKPLEEMMAYIDENGNISSAPADPKKMPVFTLDDIQDGTVVVKSSLRDKTRFGIVSNFNTSKGYGFIRDSVSRQSVFFHVNDTSELINEADSVSFEIEMRPKGPVATNVRKGAAKQ